MMMGTADEIVKAPEKGPVFVEDLPEEEQVVAVVKFLNFFLCQIVNVNKFSVHLFVVNVNYAFRAILLACLIWGTHVT